MYVLIEDKVYGRQNKNPQKTKTLLMSVDTGTLIAEMMVQGACLIKPYNERQI